MTDQITGLEQDYICKRGESLRAETAYAVEARVSPDSPFGPVQINGQIFDGKWRRVIFKELPIGVPRCPSFSQLTIQEGMFSYAAAQALQWWLHAVAEAEINSFSPIQTRLVAHRLTSTHSCEAVSVHAQIDGGSRNIWRDDP